MIAILISIGKVQMVDFIGRTAELRALNNAYQSTRTEFIPIYGRRRVGKSQLIRHFIQDKPALYFLGQAAPSSLQIKAFMEEAARVLDQPILASLAAPDWTTALNAIMVHKTFDDKIVLVLDEFQWTVQSSPELPSVLQGLLDIAWQERGDIMLIVCGSYMGFMEREILGSKSPLFGRRTAQILLKPFSFREAASFHPGWSLGELARAYFICGGIPYYLNLFSQSDSVETNIKKNILDEFAPLYREPDFLLREELRELENYYGVLMALSSGSQSNAEISRQGGINERNAHYYLRHLIELGYVSRRHPLTGRPPSARKVHFALDDPLLRFWFRFVSPNIGFISRIGPESAFSQLIRPQLESYFGHCFERLCREALPFLYEKEGINAAFEVGEYWDKTIQIDVVGHRRDHRIDIGECKWGTVRSLPSLLAELDRKMENYPNSDDATLQGRIFTQKKLKPSKTSSAVRFYSLDDLYD